MKRIQQRIHTGVLLILVMLSCSYLTQAAALYGIAGYGAWSESYTPGSNHTYYLDAVNGNDAYNGQSMTITTATNSGPWKTLAKAKAAMASGDTFYLAAGDYGDFIHTYDADLTDWVTFKALNPANRPIIGNVMLDSAGAVQRNYYIRFDGLDIRAHNVNMTVTSIPYCVGVSVNYGVYIEIRDCEIHDLANVKYHVSRAVDMGHCGQILIYHNNIHQAGAGIDVNNCQNITVSRNYIHHLGGGAGIVQRVLTPNCIVEYNHIYDSDYDLNDTCSLHSASTAAGGGCAHVLHWDVDPPHNSGLNILHPNVVMRGNIVHHIGYTAGLTFYGNLLDAGVPCFTNVVVENNLIYDVFNPYFVLNFMGNLGDNITVRNNTLVASQQDAGIAAAGLTSGMGTESTYMATGYDGTGVHIYNNVVVGRLFALPTTFDIKSNVVWSYSGYPDSFNYIAAPATNHTAVTAARGSDFASLIRFFLDNFFNGVDGLEDITLKHNQTLDFTLTGGSTAVNFGDAGLQPSESLGSLGTDGFIQINGVARDATHPSAGCYEFGTPGNAATPTPEMTATPENRSKRQAVIAFPNPAHDQVKFALRETGAQEVKIEIFNLCGERLATLKQAGSDSPFEWNCKNIAPGLYIYRTQIKANGGNKDLGIEKLAIVH